VAKFGKVDVEINVTGDLLPLARAFVLLNDALLGYDHIWTEEERQALQTVSDILYDVAQPDIQPDMLNRTN